MLLDDLASILSYGGVTDAAICGVAVCGQAICGSVSVDFVPDGMIYRTKLPPIPSDCVALIPAGGRIDDTWLATQRPLVTVACRGRDRAAQRARLQLAMATLISRLPMTVNGTQYIAANPTASASYIDKTRNGLPLYTEAVTVEVEHQ